MWTFKTTIVLPNEEVIWSLITFDDDYSKSKCPMPMNCSYPVCFLFFNHLHLQLFFVIIIILMTIKQKKEEDECHHGQSLVSIAISCCMCISHDTLHVSNFASFPFLMIALLIEVYVLIYFSSNQAILSRRKLKLKYKFYFFTKNKQQQQQQQKQQQ